MCAIAKKHLPRVVVVDDDVDLLMLLERRLQRENYAVESAASLPEAEYIIDVYKPSVLLMDINVAGEDGRQLCWKIKHNPATAHIKIVLISGYNYTINKQLLFGADEFIAKPFNTEFMVKKIDELVTGHVPPLIDEPLLQEIAAATPPVIVPMPVPQWLTA